MAMQKSMDKRWIRNLVPYDDPFLFIDKVVSLDKKKIITLKKIKGDEPFLKGHFRDFPLMPGTLAIEGIGQTGALLVRSMLKDNDKKDVLAYRLKDVKFHAPILPGSEIRFEVNLLMQNERRAIMKGKAFVKEKCAVDALLMLAIINKKDFRG
jgi:3-hydroxymyristoyl/3-hydroxydecanoyl-(acyl carrier protein) dehydratase